MKQIYIFGDSILKGVTYSEEAGRHKLLPGRFSALTEKGYAVKNCSVMGATVEEAHTILSVFIRPFHLRHWYARIGRKGDDKGTDHTHGNSPFTATGME